MWFFIVNLAERKNYHLLINKIEEFRNAFRYVKQRKPFHIDAIVILPDHFIAFGRYRLMRILRQVCMSTGKQNPYPGRLLLTRASTQINRQRFEALRLLVC